MTSSAMKTEPATSGGAAGSDTPPSPPPGKGGSNTRRAFVAALAVALALGGQILMHGVPGDVLSGSFFRIGWPAFDSQPAGLVFGLALTLVGAACFLWACRWRPPPAGGTLKSMRQFLTRRWLLVLTAVLLAVMATLVDLLLESYKANNYSIVLVLWLGGAVLYAAALVEDWSRVAGWREWLGAHREELIIVGAITLVAVILRLYQLPSLPRVINGDDGAHGNAALRTTFNPLANPFALYANFGALYLQAIAFFCRLFGRTPLALRLMPTIAGILSVPALYMFTRHLFGRRAGYLAAALITLSHAHLHFSRTVSVGYIQSNFFIPLELYLLITGLEKRSSLRLGLGGMCLGLHFSTYVSAQIITALVAAYMTIAAILEHINLLPPMLLNSGWRFLYFWLGMAVTALPQVMFDIRHPHEFLARLNKDGTFQSGWWQEQMAAGRQPAEVLFGRVWHAFFTLTHYPVIDFYEIRLPLLDIITGTLFLLGVVYALWRTAHHHYLFINGYFWAVTIAVSVFAIPPQSDGYRMLIALPAVMALAAVALDRLLTLVGLGSRDRRWAAFVAVLCLMLAIGGMNIRIFYWDYLGRCLYGGDIQTRFASYLGSYLASLDRGGTVYLLSDGLFRYGTHESVDFLSGGQPVINMDDSVEAVAAGGDVTIVAPPSRLEELRWWVRNNPGGEVRMEYDCDQPMLLGYHMP